MPHKIRFVDGELQVPDNPFVVLLCGDGIGPEVVDAAVKVVDKAVLRSYAGQRRIKWQEQPAGERSLHDNGDLLPETTLQAIRDHIVALKGPMTTPVGHGFRSANVALRQRLDLYACVRPVRYYSGVPSALRRPEKLDVVIYRENTEDVYAGVEYAAGSPEAETFIAQAKKFGSDIRRDSAIGLKPISEFASKRLIRRAIEYALENERKKITLVHKGNIMKFTEGAFQKWGYELAREMLGNRMVTGDQVGPDRSPPPGKILVQDKIADAMFQDLIRRPQWHDVIVTTNLNGDYLSDAAAAQVGGLGMAPGANIGDEAAVFEATHGSAPQYAGQDKVNPTSVILSGSLMLRYMGWHEAARLIEAAVEETILRKIVTYDLARLLKNPTEVSCSGFGKMVEDSITRMI
ncbi:MAG: NADP-dependent isocitrate dehydrogenase [Candidatus Lernaella stagnicola]|nr:NADP-dependent isocitrate dehydrogenase [Candidatus Lernaella stagnicola]